MPEIEAAGEDSLLIGGYMASGEMASLASIAPFLSECAPPHCLDAFRRGLSASQTGVVDLSRILGKTSFEAHLGDGLEPLKCSYVRGALPRDFFQREADFIRTEDDLSVADTQDYYIDMIVLGNVSWDLTDNGDPVPLTRERLTDWPAVTTCVYSAFVEALRPKAPMSEVSNSGPLPTES